MNGRTDWTHAASMRRRKVSGAMLAIIIGAIVHVLGNFAAFAIDDWSMFLASRAVVSVADGLMLSCSNAALAGSRNHTRNWGYAIVGIGAFAVAGSFGLPYLIEASGVMYFFAFLALAGVIALPTLGWLPQWTARKPGAEAPRRIFPRLEPAGLLLLVMVTFYTAGMYALIPFSAIIGQNAGWSLAQVGAVKSAAFTVAMIVPFIPIIVGTRLGLGRPLLFVGLVMTSSAFLLGFYPLGIAFVVALIGLEGIVRLGHVYLNSVLARINPAGNLNAAMQAFSGLGGVIGPTAAGLILMTGDYRSVALFSMAMLSIGIGAFIFNGFRLDRAAAAQTPPKA